jgi:N-acetylglucosamine-6-phosphate deacetylase
MESMPEQVEALVIQNTTLWTAGPAGILRDADMIVRRGRIEAIGIDLPVPEGAVVIDGSKFEVSPGLIDCHSHMATDSGVNEGTQAVTAEVRIGDFINAEDVTIYRQLAGGLTAANVLHGSANPIGGQNQVIKLRWGRPYEELKFQNAPAGVKFALGENVKQSNWTDANRTRYPQSRMGVEQLFRDRFNAARDYEKAWKDWNASPKGLPPRRDLELDALVEILRGQRWIHCHSYRQDEILALIRVCDDYGITIGSLQHILEGYKVAEAIAKHGATASSFSDWWAYKFEVYDAIPHNGALMHQQGIVVSFNSDDAELGRHMNHEAAKAVKYGGVDPHSALQFVTLNPARMRILYFGMDHRYRFARDASRLGSMVASTLTVKSTLSCDCAMRRSIESWFKKCSIAGSPREIEDRLPTIPRDCGRTTMSIAITITMRTPMACKITGTMTTSTKTTKGTSIHADLLDRLIK